MTGEQTAEKVKEFSNVLRGVDVAQRAGAMTAFLITVFTFLTEEQAKECIAAAFWANRQ